MHFVRIEPVSDVFRHNDPAQNLNPYINPMRLNPLKAVLASLAGFCFLPSLSAAVFLLDFGGTNTTGTGAAPNDPVNTWNNVTLTVAQNNAGQLSNLVTTTGTASTVSLQMVSRFNGDNADGTQASPLYPTNATRDSLYGNTGVFNNLTNVFPAFKITGLDAGSVYIFTFFASRMNVGDNRETQYDVAGASSAVTFLNAANNIDNTATVSGIAPDANGEIAISLTPGSNNNNGATRFTYLGVLKIESLPVPEPATGVLALAGLLVLGRRHRNA